MRPAFIQFLATLIACALLAQQALAEPTTQPKSADSIWDSTVGGYVDHASPLLGASGLGEQTPFDPTPVAGATPPPPPSAPSVFETPATSQPAVSAPTTQPAKSGGEWLIAPLPTHNPEFGWGITGVLGYIFPLDPDDKVSPPSTVAGFGYYSQNQTWAAGLATKLYVDEDRYRITAAGIFANVNYDFFGTGTEAGKAGKSVPLSQQMAGGLLEGLFRVVPNVYIGPRYLGAHISVSADTSELNPPVVVPPSELHTTFSGLGVHAQWDTRDSQFYPRKGFLLDGDVSFHDPAIGDNFAYQVYQIAYNHYLSLSAKQVLAFRAMGQFESGDVPFYGLSQFGRGSDLRGYRLGQYQDKQMLAGQVEYRLEITKRFGVVAFGGVGEVAPSISDMNFDNLLPSAGAGLRFVAAEKNHVSIRLDVAWGRDDGVFYLAVGEAF